MEQRSDEWFNQRLGRFTASTIHELLTTPAAFEKECFKKACEIVFGRDEYWDVESWDMKRGNTLEPEAIECFTGIMARKFVKVEPCFFFPYESDGGASPDSLVGNDATLQVKCPRPEKLFNLIKEGIKAIDKNYISQMNMEMLSTNSTHVHFFNYAIWKGSPIHHTIIIEPDKEIQEKIIEVIPKAAKLRDQLVEQLKNNVQFEL